MKPVNLPKTPNSTQDYPEPTKRTNYDNPLMNSFEPRSQQEQTKTVKLLKLLLLLLLLHVFLFRWGERGRRTVVKWLVEQRRKNSLAGFNSVLSSAHQD